MHNTTVVRVHGQAHKFEIVCQLCGVVGKQRTNRKMAFEKAAKHQLDGKAFRMRGVRANVAKAAWIESPVVRPAAPKTKEEWYAYVHAHGMPKLGQGASRKVYALDADRVIKIEYAAFHGQSQCSIEAARWERSTPEERRFLATIHEYGNGWIIMERAKFTIKALDDKTSEMVIRDISSLTRIRDLHPGNIGYFAGAQFKVIDYGL